MGTGTADRDNGGYQIGAKRSFARSKGRSQVQLGNEEKHNPRSEIAGYQESSPKITLPRNFLS